ncbi:MAG: hypothetical protein EA404_02020 [Spirochaetaceae bacterium]|nr:MAG: hypothetical protein EA404_02020 [Spirochaetaceae bacterium]
MDSYKKKIDRLQDEMEQKRALIAQDYVAIGSHLLANETARLSSKKLVAQKEEVSRIEAEIEGHKRYIEKINAIVNRRQQIENDIEKHQLEIEELDQSVAPMYEQIGEQAFEVYKQNPFVDQQFVDMFSDLVKNQEDIREIDEQLDHLEKETGEKPFLDRMVAKGKIALLRNRRTTREQNTPRLMRKAGKAVTESNFVTVVDAPDLTRALEPYHEVHSHIDRIRGLITDLENERASLDSELAELEADKKPLRRVSDLEQQIESLRATLESVYQQTGDTYLTELKKDEQPPEAVAEPAARVQTHQKEIAALEKQIERLRAAITVEELEDKISGYQKKISTLEEKIAEQQRMVQQYQQEMTDAEAEKARLEKQRGPLDKL